MTNRARATTMFRRHFLFAFRRFAPVLESTKISHFSGMISVSKRSIYSREDVRNAVNSLNRKVGTQPRMQYKHSHDVDPVDSIVRAVRLMGLTINTTREHPLSDLLREKDIMRVRAFNPLSAMGAYMRPAKAICVDYERICASEVYRKYILYFQEYSKPTLSLKVILAGLTKKIGPLQITFHGMLKSTFVQFCPEINSFTADFADALANLKTNLSCSCNSDFCIYLQL
ncbi:hypothetical protein WN51_08636 [Melipona quadrifasciata]|uniref:Uncharacterized protein n=1 Tax=Melipona quadrifasciata TaxID=166423 RepID=A0A0M9A7M5_9HYME|nr:hypothetical protein WN51_08636 [Melipona quadrifasciata]